MDPTRVRRFGTGMILVAGCLAAALLHLALELEGERGIGPGMSHAYAHLLVMPLLLGGIVGAAAFLVLRTARAWSTWKRSRVLQSVAEHVGTEPAVRVFGLIGVTALVVLAINELLEQLLSLGHVDLALPLGTPISLSFVLQLVAIAVAVGALLKAALIVVFLAVRVVDTVLTALYHSIRTGQPSRHLTPHAALCTSPLPRLLTRSAGKRAPPHLQTA